MTDVKDLAWEIYCFETVGDMNVSDFWDELSDAVKTAYIKRAELLLSEPKNLEIKQVLVLRKDLNMRKGKMVAQGAHASMAAVIKNDAMANTVYISNDKYTQQWFAGRFTKVCVGADSEEELIEIHRKAGYKGLNHSLITDAGLTEFNGIPTKTAVAVGPAPAWMVDEITGKLKLL